MQRSPSNVGRGAGGKFSNDDFGVIHKTPLLRLANILSAVYFNPRGNVNLLIRNKGCSCIAHFKFNGAIESLDIPRENKTRQSESSELGWISIGCSRG